MYLVWISCGRKISTLDTSQLSSDGAPNIHDYLKNGKTLLVSASVGGDRQKLVEVDATTGDILDTVLEHDRYDITGPALVKNGELIGVQTTFDKRGHAYQMLFEHRSIRRS